MRKIILDWLNTKVNYVSYKSNLDMPHNFQNKIGNLLPLSRIYKSDLEACDCYIIQNVLNKIDYTFEHTNNARHNFENFNIKRNEYVFDKANMEYVCKNFTIEDKERNRAIILQLFNELKHNYNSKNTYLEKFDKYKYKDIFSDIDKYSIEKTKINIETALQQNEFNFEDYKSAYIDRIKEESRGLQEIGIFYPFKFDHDIFISNKYYLFEINILKLQKKSDNFLKIIENYYNKYGINCDRSKKIFTLNEYFVHPGLEYSKDFAYFNPFLNCEKYENQYKQIEKNISQKNLKLKDFLFELFDTLNIAQINIANFQHKNLIDTLIMTRSLNRPYSFRELVDIQMKKIENNESHIYGYERQLYCAILHAFKNQPYDFIFMKNTKIDDIESFATWPESMKQKAQSILDLFLDVLNKNDSSKLQYIFDSYKKELNIINKKYKLSPENKLIVYDMLLDLVFFYNDKSKEKLSKPFNSTIKKIYQKNQNNNIAKNIDVDFQVKFMLQYNEFFNAHKPSEMKTETGEATHVLLN